MRLRLLPGASVVASIGVSLSISLATVSSAVLALPRGDVREVTRSVLSDERFQTQVNPHASSEEPRPPEPRQQTPRDTPSTDRVWPAPPEASNVSRALLWLFGGIALLALLALTVAEIRRRLSIRALRLRSDRRPARTVSHALEALPASLDQARRLAASGDYQAAVHTLLEAALDYLRAVSGFDLEPCYTSREILEKAPITQALTPAFEDLVVTVEISLFGGVPIDIEDFRRCERSFVRVQEGLSNGH